MAGDARSVTGYFLRGACGHIDPYALCKNPQERTGAQIPEWCAGLPLCILRGGRWKY